MLDRSWRSAAPCYDQIMASDAGSRSLIAITLLAFVVYVASFLRGFGRLFFLAVCGGVALQSAMVMLVAWQSNGRRRDAALEVIARRGGRVLARPAEHPERVLELSFAGTQLTDPDLESLSGLRHLEVLDLADTSVGDEGLVHLGAVRSLRALDLSGTRVTDRGLLHLETLPRLKWIDLSATSVTEDGIERLLYLQPGIEIAGLEAFDTADDEAGGL
jgi:Leucine Rich repeat